MGSRTNLSSCQSFLLNTSILLLLSFLGLQSCNTENFKHILQNEISANPEPFLRNALLPNAEMSLFEGFTDNDLFIFVESVDNSAELIAYTIYGTHSRTELLGDLFLLSREERILKWQKKISWISEGQECLELLKIIHTLSSKQKVAIGFIQGNKVYSQLQKECEWSSRIHKFIPL